MQDIQHYGSVVTDLMVTYGPKLFWAVATYLVGSWLIGKLALITDKALEKSEMDVSLRGFIKSLINVGLKILLIFSVVAMLGVATTSIVALLGTAGLAVGMALQGSLANFAGGVLILFFKPFKVGDYIKTADHEGEVEEIQMFVTILKTLDNQRVIIPNGVLSNQSLTNVYSNGVVKLSHTFGIGYNDDIDKAKAIVLEVAKSISGVQQEPAPQVLVSAHGDSAVDLLLWTWVEPKDHWDVHFALFEEVKKAFDKEGITIPYPQRDIHLFKADA